MSEDKLQAAKDEAAKEFQYEDFNDFLNEIQFTTNHEKNLENIIGRAMQLYAAQCVTDEREMIKNAMPGIAYDIESCYNSICREQSDNGEWIDRYRLSQLIERGEG